VWEAAQRAQCFSRLEREIPFEPDEFRAREADGCKPLLGRFRGAIVFSRAISFATTLNSSDLSLPAGRNPCAPFGGCIVVLGGDTTRFR
jgi:hypothetical protein